MGIQHDEVIPASFADAFSDNYLGSPDVVSRLVAAYLAECEKLLYDHSDAVITPAEFRVQVRGLIQKNADIFSGRDPAYKFVKGYNDFSLGFKLKADLGAFWQSNRAAWSDDPVCVLFEWLLVMFREELLKSGGEDWLLGIMIKPSVEYTVKVLLGIEERAKP